MYCLPHETLFKNKIVRLIKSNNDIIYRDGIVCFPFRCRKSHIKYKIQQNGKTLDSFSHFLI